MSDDLEGMATFVAVADARGFRAAGERLGVTGSAVSQAIRRLEERIGMPLIQRTTRSVRLTEAGERLYSALRPALDDVKAAVAAVSEMGSEPRGTIRLHVAAAAETYLTGPLLAGFLATHAHVNLDVVLGDDALDIVAEGYDAGIRLGEVIDGDMIAEPISGDLRLLVIGAPSYFSRRKPPSHPRDLADHECINWHPTSGAKPYRWEFTENGRDFSVAVPARVLTTDPVLNVRLALAGVGLTLATEDRVRGEIARGELVTVLEAFSTPFPGFYLYYPQLKRASPALRAFVEYLRALREPKRRR
jgi:DNA-binding transcriptional LysR family regulator